MNSDHYILEDEDFNLDPFHDNDTIAPP